MVDSVSAWQRFWERGGVLRAALIAVIYIALYLVAGRLVGLLFRDQVDFDDPLSGPGSIFFGLVLAILVGIVLLYAFAASLGWTRELYARQPIGGSWWMWILPIVILGYNILRFVAVDYSHYSVGTVVMVLFLGLCVGVAEETITRGLVVNLLRKGGCRELVVALLSSLLFALMHSTNLLSGQNVLTVGLTVVYTFAFGVGMYFTLRVTRNLIWPILLHASTDPSALLLSGGLDKAGAGAAQSTLASIAATANFAVIGLGFILVWFVRGRVLEARTSVEPSSA